MKRWIALALSLLPALAFGSVGKVTALEGSAWRTRGGDLKAILVVGAPISEGDILYVGTPGRLKITLDDGSELALDAGSVLDIQQALFGGEQRTFFGKLRIGKMLTWVKNKLTGSKAKFEVGTERAVAGVRGTLFEVEVTFGMAQAAAPRSKITRVAVTKGKVAVRAQPPAAQGRHQVAGPQQVTKKEWERRFVLLQRNRMVEIGDDGWKESKYDPSRDADLRKFLNATP